VTDQRIGFGGGCHWCTEAVFSVLRGVSDVAQGFIRSASPDDSYSEAVIVTYDPSQISPTDLTRVHLATHASTANHSMRGKYRSAVYADDAATLQAARAALATLQADYTLPLVTRALPLAGFRASDPRFHDYYKTDPQRPFCIRYIDPKLALLRRDHASLLPG